MKKDDEQTTASDVKAPPPDNHRVIHIHTVMQTVFGLVDEHGNVVEKRPVTLEVGVLSEQAFTEAVLQLQRVRGELVKVANGG